MIQIHRRFLGIGECYIASMQEHKAVASKVGTKIEDARIDLNVRNSLCWPLADNFTKYLEMRVYREINEVADSSGRYTVMEMHGITYNPGGLFKAHQDVIRGVGRRYTGIILLSDPEDFEGGILHVKQSDKYNSHSLDRGDLIIFPSNLMHYVSKVVSGDRKVIVFWIY